MSERDASIATVALVSRRLRAAHRDVHANAEDAEDGVLVNRLFDGVALLITAGVLHLWEVVRRMQCKIKESQTALQFMD